MYLCIVKAHDNDTALCAYESDAVLRTYDTLRYDNFNDNEEKG